MARTTRNSVVTKCKFVRLISLVSLFTKIGLSRKKTTMNRISRYPVWVIAALMFSIGSIAGGAFVGSSMIQAGHAPESAVAAAAAAVREAVAMPATFAPVVKAVLPAVVNISSTRVIRTSGRSDNPFDDLFPGFGFRMPDRPLRQQGEGSGVI